MVFAPFAMEPPEYDGPRSCSECRSWMESGLLGYGICAAKLGRFYDDEIENTPKYRALGLAVDWVLDNIVTDETDACDEFGEA